MIRIASTNKPKANRKTYSDPYSVHIYDRSAIIPKNNILYGCTVLVGSGRDEPAKDRLLRSS